MATQVKIDKRLIRKITNNYVDEKLKNRGIIRLHTIAGTKIKHSWKCSVCAHIWATTCDSILNSKSKCPRCSHKLKLSNNDVDYRLKGKNIKRVSDIKSFRVKCTWKCSVCEHEWITTPDAVLNSNTGCPKCINYISNPETQWLDLLGVPNTPTHRQVSNLIPTNTRVKVDGYTPETNTVYEFWGDYWHGNPTKFNSYDMNKQAHKTFGELYQKTMQKRQVILDTGYNLVEIWESDWKAQQKDNYD